MFLDNKGIEDNAFRAIKADETCIASGEQSWPLKAPIVRHPLVPSEAAPNNPWG